MLAFVTCCGGTESASLSVGDLGEPVDAVLTETMAGDAREEPQDLPAAPDGHPLDAPFVEELKPSPDTVDVAQVEEVSAEDLPPVGPCDSDEDCFEGSLCDVASGECVDCLTTLDCGENQECVGGECHDYEPCASSKDCDLGVCWVEFGKCVDCIDDADCDDAICEDNICVTITACVSDKDCKALDMVCDKELAYCVECLGHEDCADAYHCVASKCIVDICLPESQSCQENAIVTCNGIGDAFTAPQPCPEATSCHQEGLSAQCAEWVCEPGSSACDPATGHAVECSDDGLLVLLDVDCQEDGLLCVAGACLPMVCAPGEMKCDEDGFARLTCNEDGTTWVLKPCPPETFCEEAGDEGNAVCSDQVCVPDLPLCLGSVASQCNANGSSILPGGTDCQETGLTCLAGQCTQCQPSEICDGVDNDCDGVVDNGPTDCPGVSLCFSGTCYTAPDDNCWVKPYSNHVYLACYLNGTNWYEAKDICENWHGSHLVVLNNAPEEQFVSSNITGPGYIGYTDEAQEGIWVWATGSSDYTNWCPQQPDNWQNNEHCATLKNNLGGGSDCWNDVACSGNANRFICEVDAP